MSNETIKDLSKVPAYQLVHGFKRAQFPGDGFWYDRDQVKPWCVYFAHSGHYFVTMIEALQYAAQRKFIPVNMMESIANNLQSKGFNN